jgi:hypothetical protein
VARPSWPGRKRRPTERERRRRQRQTRRDYSPHKMTAPRRRVTTSSPKLRVQQPGLCTCRALPPLLSGPSPPTSMGAPRAAALRSSSLKKKGVSSCVCGLLSTSSTAQPRQGRGLTATSMRTTALLSTAWAARPNRGGGGGCARALAVHKPPPPKKRLQSWSLCRQHSLTPL